MRTFIIPGHRVVTGGDFSLNDLSGSTGRLDILLRCVNSAFFLSNGLRKDVLLYLVLLGPPAPPRAVKFVGSELRYLNPDERSTAALVRTALLRKCGPDWQRSTPGIYCAKKGFAEVAKECAGSEKEFVYLKEDGRDIREMRFKEPVFVLGDQYDLTLEEEALLSAYNPVKLSIGPKPLHSDHCITIVNGELDRAGL